MVGQELRYFGVTHLAKVIIPGADTPEWGRREQSDGLADQIGGRGCGIAGRGGGLRTQIGDGTRRRDGDGGHDFMGLPIEKCLDGGAHGCAGCQAIVDQEDGAASDGLRRAIAAEEAGAAGQFTLLLAGYLLDTSVAQPLLRDNGLIDDLDAAFSDGAEGKFSLAGYAQFSHE